MNLGTRTIEGTVLELVGELVAELRGSSARQTVTLDSSLARDLGLGTLERVELLLRLERAFGVLLADTTMAEAETPRRSPARCGWRAPPVRWSFPSPRRQPPPVFRLPRRRGRSRTS